MTQEIKTLLSIGVISLILIVGAVLFLGKQAPQQTSQESKVDMNILIRENSHKISTDSAKVNIVEFSDFQCPACAAAHPVVNKILEDYKGKVNFVYRHFPLPQHPYGTKAAIAAEAAGEQGKFWEMYNKLFDKQAEWSESKDVVANFTGYAQELNLDINKFKQDMESGKYDERIKSDQSDGVAAKINATPTFFINGEKISGAGSYDDFKTKIDSALSK